MYQKQAANEFEALRFKKDVVVLGVETSCDETAVSIVKNGREVLANAVASQIPIHRKFGGVVPEVASRNHTLAMNAVAEEALCAANLKGSDVDAVAVTYGAGLAGALLVGVSFAKAAAFALKKPLIQVNHIEAHIAANYIAHPDLKPPFLALAASGGHTGIVAAYGFDEYSLLGGTVDDAIGEAFDKVARLLGLPYPGGPEIERLAQSGRPVIEFYKREKGAAKDLRLSYSGLKTAVVNYLHTAEMRGQEINKADVCASFTRAAVDTLVETVVYAAKTRGFSKIALAGGVAANGYLRDTLRGACEAETIEVFAPPLYLCTDNAAMVAARAYFSILAGTNLAGLDLNADSALRVKSDFRSS